MRECKRCGAVDETAIANDWIVCARCYDPIERLEPHIGPLIEYDPATGKSRYFSSGATRDSAEGKLDIHRFLSPEVLRRYCQYL